MEGSLDDKSFISNSSGTMKQKVLMEASYHLQSIYKTGKGQTSNVDPPNTLTAVADSEHLSACDRSRDGSRTAKYYLEKNKNSDMMKRWKVGLLLQRKVDAGGINLSVAKNKLTEFIDFSQQSKLRQLGLKRSEVVRSWTQDSVKLSESLSINNPYRQFSLLD